MWHLRSLVNCYQGFGSFKVTEMMMHAAVLSRTVLYVPYYFEFKMLFFFMFFPNKKLGFVLNMKYCSSLFESLKKT